MTWLDRLTRLPALLIGAAALLLAVQGAAGASEAVELHSFGIVMGRDLAARTLEIDGVHYRVSPRTIIKDLEGNAIGFEELEIFDVHQGLFAIQDATCVEYAARQISGQWTLEYVRRVPKLPL